MIWQKKSPQQSVLWRIDTGGVTRILVGLGNPGTKFVGTRHNVGFDALDFMAKEAGVAMKKIQFKSLTGIGEIGGQKTLLMKPQTFMNLSGQAVQEAMAFYKIKPEHVLVLLDDINLDVGVIRLRRKGSDGGQKGMQNIIYLTASDQFPRVKIGVGHKPHPDYDLADWVLSRFSPAEKKKVDARHPDIFGASGLILSGQMDEAMNRYTG